MLASKRLGADLRKTEYALSDQWIFTNHGSYGACPNTVSAKQHELRADVEAQPDRWFRDRKHALWVETIGHVADFMGADPEDCVFVPNPTSGTNAVLKSFLSSKKESILIITNLTYPSVVSLAEQLHESFGVTVIKVEIVLPTTHDEVMATYEQALDGISDRTEAVKLAVIDAITSPTAQLMPYARLTELLRSRGILSFVDAAHALGQLPLSVGELQPDFLVATFHKWMFTPRGCSVLYVKRQHADRVLPVVWCAKMPSSHISRTSLHARFVYQGTMDETAFYCAPAGIEFHRQCGGLPAIHANASELFDKAVPLLVKCLGTEEFPTPDEMKAPYMRLIRLPDNIPYGDRVKKKTTDSPMQFNSNQGFNNRHGFAHLFECLMREKYKIQTCPISLNGKPYIRISAFVYNTMDDFQQLATALENCLKDPVPDSF